MLEDADQKPGHDIDGRDASAGETSAPSHVCLAGIGSPSVKLGDVISSLWTNFVKNGNPNGAGTPEWPPYDPKWDLLLNIGDTPKAQPAPFKAQLDFLEEWAAAQRK